MKCLFLLIIFFSVLLWASPVHAGNPRFSVDGASYTYFPDKKTLMVRALNNNVVKIYNRVHANFTHNDETMTSKISFYGNYFSKFEVGYDLIQEDPFKKVEGKDGFKHCFKRFLYNRHDPEENSYEIIKEYWEKTRSIAINETGPICIGKKMEGGLFTGLQNLFKGTNAAQGNNEVHYILWATRTTSEMFTYRKERKEDDYEGGHKVESSVELLEFKEAAVVNPNSLDAKFSTCPSCEKGGLGSYFQKTYNGKSLFPCSTPQEEITCSLNSFPLKQKDTVSEIP